MERRVFEQPTLLSHPWKVYFLKDSTLILQEIYQISNGKTFAKNSFKVEGEPNFPAQVPDASKSDDDIDDKQRWEDNTYDDGDNDNDDNDDQGGGKLPCHHRVLLGKPLLAPICSSGAQVNIIIFIITVSNVSNPIITGNCHIN